MENICTYVTALFSELILSAKFTEAIASFCSLVANLTPFLLFPFSPVNCVVPQARHILARNELSLVKVSSLEETAAKKAFFVFSATLGQIFSNAKSQLFAAEEENSNELRKGWEKFSKTISESWPDIRSRNASSNREITYRKRQVSPMIHSAIPTVSPVVNIVFA